MATSHRTHHTTHVEKVVENESEHHFSHNQIAAEAVVRNFMLWTGAAGIIPVPVVDTAAIAAIQLAMLQKIGSIYGHKLSSHWGKSTISSITGGYISTTLGKGIGRNIVKGIPVIGSLTSLLIAPGFAAASTWALGKVFIAHFESGGTLLTFNPEHVKDYYQSLVKHKTANPSAE